MKANYPVEFLAASMTLDMRQYRQARRISPRGGAPRHQGRAAIGQSLRRHFEVGDRTILYALAALKGVGQQAVETIVAARGERAVPRPRRFRGAASIRAPINKRVLESLVAAGALDCLEPDRARAFAAIDA